MHGDSADLPLERAPPARSSPCNDTPCLMPAGCCNPEPARDSGWNSAREVFAPGNWEREPPARSSPGNDTPCLMLAGCCNPEPARDSGWNSAREVFAHSHHSPTPSQPPPAGYVLPTCRAALGRAARAPRGAGFQPAWRHHRHRRQVLAVTAGA
ncbi:MAG: hypothetical protein KatS3mg045_1940 [Bellilinea sp.]|nr:MAG: hypothetical protein KatS3mg045_1940 [Bellilinea sp.]